MKCRLKYGPWSASTWSICLMWGWLSSRAAPPPGPRIWGIGVLVPGVSAWGGRGWAPVLPRPLAHGSGGWTAASAHPGAPAPTVPHNINNFMNFIKIGWLICLFLRAFPPHRYNPFLLAWVKGWHLLKWLNMY